MGDGVRDCDVRLALRQKVFNEHLADDNTLVVEELGLRHGACRVDIAVINGLIHGYEIKSDADTLARLPAQIATYSAVLDRATLVVGEKHAAKAVEILPDWWGIKVVSLGPRGAFNFDHVRKPKMNANIDKVALAELLWREEVADILADVAPPTLLRKPRAHLYRHLAETTDLDELRRLVRQRLKARANWRDRPSPSSSDGLSPPIPTSSDSQ